LATTQDIKPHSFVVTSTRHRVVLAPISSRLPGQRGLLGRSPPYGLGDALPAGKRSEPSGQGLAAPKASVVVPVVYEHSMIEASPHGRCARQKGAEVFS